MMSWGCSPLRYFPQEYGAPPSIGADGDEVKMVDPKAAVMKMLRDTKDQQEKNKLQGELSLIEKKKNKESWRRGIIGESEER